MPTWDKKCNACGDLYEVICKIQEKDNQHECPYCGQTDGTWMLSAPMVSMERGRFMNTDNRTGFGDVVKKIQKAYPNSEISRR